MANQDDSLKPEATYRGTLDMQVCIPKDWTDDQVKEFAEKINPCGTSHGWDIRREGDELLDGDPERLKCASRIGFVHIMLDA